MKDFQKWAVIIGLAVIGAAIYANSVQVKKAVDSIVGPVARNI